MGVTVAGIRGGSGEALGRTGWSRQWAERWPLIAAVVDWKDRKGGESILVREKEKGGGDASPAVEQTTAAGGEVGQDGAGKQKKGWWPVELRGFTVFPEEGLGRFAFIVLF